MPESEAVALIDLDGSVADFDGEMRRQLVAMAGPGEDISPEFLENSRKHPYMTTRRRLIKAQPGFWRQLPPLPRGMEVVHIMRELDFRLVVLTKGPQRTTPAWTEKVEWVQEHIPDASSCIVEGRQDKGLVYGRVLFDDWPDYVESWLEWRPRGLVIMTDQLWNRDYFHPNVFRLMMDTPMDEVRAKLQEARDR